jgi:hypothetical protein
MATATTAAVYKHKRILRICCSRLSAGRRGRMITVEDRQRAFCFPELLGKLPLSSSKRDCCREKSDLQRRRALRREWSR